ncbi:hypothetical protein D3C84_748230 [compost metagenome]
MFIGKGCSKQTINVVRHFPLELFLQPLNGCVLQKRQDRLSASLCSTEFLLRHGLPTTGLKTKIRPQNEHHYVSLINLRHACFLRGVRPCAKILAHDWGMPKKRHGLPGCSTIRLKVPNNGANEHLHRDPSVNAYAPPAVEAK